MRPLLRRRVAAHEPDHERIVRYRGVAWRVGEPTGEPSSRYTMRPHRRRETPKLRAPRSVIARHDHPGRDKTAERRGREKHRRQSAGPRHPRDCRALSHGTCPCARRSNRSSACVTLNQLGERLPHRVELALRYAPLRCTLDLTQRLDFVGRKTATPDCRLDEPHRLTRLEEIRRMGACCQLTRSVSPVS